MSWTEKLCPKCDLMRPVEAYSKRHRGPYNKMAVCLDCTRKGQQRRRHGMTTEERRAAADKQGGCPICHSRTTGAIGWVVDHDHSCCPGERSCVKCRRGLICTACNNALGYARDSPEILRSLAEYLERYAERRGGAIDR